MCSRYHSDPADRRLSSFHPINSNIYFGPFQPNTDMIFCDRLTSQKERGNSLLLYLSNCNAVKIFEDSTTHITHSTKLTHLASGMLLIILFDIIIKTTCCIHTKRPREMQLALSRTERQAVSADSTAYRQKNFTAIYKNINFYLVLWSKMGYFSS